MNIDIEHDMEKSESNIFLVVWDMYGLESVIDVGDLDHLRQEAEKQRLVEILSDPNSTDPGNRAERELMSKVNFLLMRARINSQRHYEVYTIHCEPDVTGDQLREMFEADPQAAADLIRRYGQELYSDRSHTHRQVIV